MALVKIDVPIIVCKKCKVSWMPRHTPDNIVMKGKQQYIRVDRCKSCKNPRWDEE